MSIAEMGTYHENREKSIRDRGHYEMLVAWKFAFSVHNCRLPVSQWEITVLKWIKILIIYCFNSKFSMIFKYNSIPIMIYLSHIKLVSQLHSAVSLKNNTSKKSFTRLLLSVSFKSKVWFSLCKWKEKVSLNRKNMKNIFLFVIILLHVWNDDQPFKAKNNKFIECWSLLLIKL